MQNEDEYSELTDESTDMSTEGAVHPSTELRKRRSTRIVQAVPLVVTGVDALGRPFAERTSTLIINCHGCRYQSKHYVLKNMWVNLEVPHPDAGHPPRRVRGKVAWIQRPRTVRQLFQVALELESSGNVWGIGFPPEDWFTFPDEAPFAASGEATGSPLPPPPPGTPLPIAEAEPGIATPDNLRVFPAPASATDASLQLARQVARLLAEAKQQIHAAAKEAASQAVAAERNLSAEEWERKYAAFREEIARETAHAIGSIEEETSAYARTAQAAAADSIKNELPRWLAPQLEQLTQELTEQLAREGAMQRDQHEKQLATAQETLLTLCTQAEEATAKLRTHAEQVESESATRLEAAKRQAEDEAQRREEVLGAQREAFGAALNEIQQKMSVSFAETQNALREQMTKDLGAAQQQAAAGLQEQAQTLRQELQQESEAQSLSVTQSLTEKTRQLEETLARANQATERLEQYASRIEAVQQQAISGFQSQLDDVLSLHRNELHRQSDSLFEEIHTRIRSSFEAANSEALQKFEQHVESMVQPHITRTEEAVHRLAGGRSLLDAAFAESLARFRENLGSVESLLNESAQGITGRHMEGLETKAVDLKHHTMEELFKSSEWYEKRAQTQLQNTTEKLMEQAGSTLREKAGEVSSLFAGELSQASGNYVEQTHR